jgi:hypothetical protein
MPKWTLFIAVPATLACVLALLVGLSHGTAPGPRDGQPAGLSAERPTTPVRHVDERELLGVIRRAQNAPARDEEPGPEGRIDPEDMQVLARTLVRQAGSRSAVRARLQQVVDRQRDRLERTESPEQRDAIELQIRYLATLRVVVEDL